MNKLDQVLNARAGGAVERCHTVRHIGEYTNAQHQWGVAMLLHQLYPMDVANRLVWFALTHDVPEGLTGDIPSTAKDAETGLDDFINRQLGLPKVGILSPNDAQILHSVDKLDLYLWAKEQHEMGNRFTDEIIDTLDYWFLGQDCDSTVFQFYLLVAHTSSVPDRVGLTRKMKEAFKLGGSI